MRRIRQFGLLFALVFLSACGTTGADLAPTFDEAVQEAEQTTVNFYLWGGDDGINRYIDDYVAPRLKETYDIELNRVPMDTAEFIRQLSLDKRSNREAGTIDLMWINGDNFRNAAEAELLQGDLLDKIPNAALLNETAQATDAGTPTDGLEVAWGNVQFVLHYDADKVTNPPATFEELHRWTEANPGRFTYPEVTDFTGNAFVRHLLYAEYGETIRSDQTIPDAFWDELATWSPNLWKQGATYPKSLAQLDQLYAKGDVWMTMGFNERRAEAERNDGVFPDGTRALVLDHSIASTHFLAVPFNASNPNGAIVVINELLSPEAQLAKQDATYWGDGTSLDLTKLERADREAFLKLDTGVTYPDPEQLAERSIADFGPSVIDQVREGWSRVAR
ncbi:ABC transporter substrate-binding protein [Exiguobacterium sp. SH0S1]|uniref:ABC transporter substrate-binding protein n=1 Tax=Exiguobacterium TaxID=33986 RepID=UPI000877771D|nr:MULTISPECIES: ABC transporter substrate-binding protein [Exiguobacterium]TCI80586.1 ABC transporter substrate-binding protein [Exiguobacterium sp. SH0S1]